MSTKVLNNVVLIAILFSLPFMARSQMWTRYRNELYFGGGMSTILSDLGGGSGTANHFFKDMNLPASSFAFSAGWRYRFAERFTARAELGYTRVRGGDSLTTNYDRSRRNLSFRTDIFEFTPLVEFYIVKESTPIRPAISHLFEPSNIFSLYVATGISVIYFNPKAQLNGEWIALQPLGTEGQGLKEGTKKYSRIHIAIPLNVGFKFEIPSKYTMRQPTWTVTLELGARWAMTDYLDDVSTTYYDNRAIAEAYGPQAAALSDQRLSHTRGNGKGKRGDPNQNDFYGTIQFKVSRHLRGRGRPKNFTRRYRGF